MKRTLTYLSTKRWKHGQIDNRKPLAVCWWIKFITLYHGIWVTYERILENLGARQTCVQSPASSWQPVCPGCPALGFLFEFLPQPTLIALIVSVGFWSHKGCSESNPSISLLPVLCLIWEKKKRLQVPRPSVSQHKWEQGPNSAALGDCTCAVRGPIEHAGQPTLQRSKERTSACTSSRWIQMCAWGTQATCSSHPKHKFRPNVIRLAASQHRLPRLPKH